ncbi:hypothetical protein CORC01_10937 [Colletotrichum orchidophilum]|uniref:Uncharacterized protein n=1 Tax=Colletotrichum orchidophilum TaxID=1209926 RepID=A0A1G4AXF0_9PEZI|nr:uncharacterized protein CORC01_10937 [Colletotrichum orchidophilum]OHE93811.1 hypothetical protein CORC01_10937 [Colletotrichum orchidophilum]
MERDIRRDRGEWRGCHTFKDIVLDDDLGVRDTKRNGGLKMGNTYYYYYEIDGTQESHNPALPSTTNCPYLPGQAVNTLDVPYEVAERKRSASLGSLRPGEQKTMNPEDKFITPRPPPPVPGGQIRRLGSAPAAQPTRAISRADSTSPPPPWRRMFNRKPSTSRLAERGRQHDDEACPLSPYSGSSSDDSRSMGSSERSRSRDLSPESLRRFLSDENPFASTPSSAYGRPPVAIPDDIAEENDDDENFANSAYEVNPYTTSLSPPPFKRSHSDSTLPVVPAPKVLTREKKYSPLPPLPVKAVRDLATAPSASRFSFSSDSSIASSIGPISPEDDTPSFYDSTEEDRDSNESETSLVQPLSLPSTRKPSLEQNYSLPRAAGIKVHPGVQTVVAAPVDNGLDDLVNEMGWMVDVIRGKGI